MNSRWKAFLDGQQSRDVDGNMAVEILSAPRSGECALIDLSIQKLIRVEGEDAQKFLQGQITNDIRNVTENQFQIAGYCTPKGRMLASFLIIQRQQSFLLQMPAATHEVMLKRLPMFVLMSRVIIEDASDDLVRFGLAGDTAARHLGTIFEKVPASPWESAQERGLLLLRHPGHVPRFELIGEVEPMIELWTELSAEAAQASSGYWSLLDIQAGIPSIHAATIEAFVPQMTNMQLINGVSFTKGCYTGQEVVARMKYLGKLKRRMYLARVDSTLAPHPGDELFSSDSRSGQGAGRVVDAQPSPAGGFELLAVMEIASHAADDVHLNAMDGPKLEFQPLPYSFEQE